MFTVTLTTAPAPGKLLLLLNKKCAIHIPDMSNKSSNIVGIIWDRTQPVVSLYLETEILLILMVYLCKYIYGKVFMHINYSI